MSDWAPERIWLQRDTHGETTWCSEPVEDDDVEYVRATPAEPSDVVAADVHRAIEHFRTLAVNRRREFGGSEAARIYDRIADSIEALRQPAASEAER